MFTFLLAAALADQAAPEPPCGGGWVSGALPLANAVDVPVDVAPAILLPTCSEQTEVLVTIQPVAGTGTAYSEVVPVPTVADTGAQILDLPTLSLDPGTTYEVLVEGLWSNGSWSFETGTSTATALTDPDVALRVDSAYAYEGDAAEVTFAIEGAGVHPARLTSPDLPALEHGFLTSDGWVSLYGLSLPDEEACFTLEIRDATGAWVEQDPLCVVFEVYEDDLYDGGLGFLGCSTSGSWGLAFGLLPLAFVRRRR